MRLIQSGLSTVVLFVVTSSFATAADRVRTAPAEMAAPVTGQWRLDFPTSNTLWNFEETSGSYVADQAQPTCDEIDLGLFTINVCTRQSMLGLRAGNFLIGLNQVEISEDLTDSVTQLPYGVHIIRVTNDSLDGIVISVGAQTGISGERTP